MPEVFTKKVLEKYIGVNLDFHFVHFTVGSLISPLEVGIPPREVVNLHFSPTTLTTEHAASLTTLTETCSAQTRITTTHLRLPNLLFTNTKNAK
jgi:hypothetical protein